MNAPRRRVVAAALALLASGCAVGPPVGSPALGDARPGAGARILLTVPEQTTTALPLTGAPAQRYLRRRAYGPTPAVDRVLDALAREHGLRRVEGWPIRSLNVYCEVFAVADGDRVDSLLQALAADDRVRLAQRMNTFRTLTGRTGDTYADLQPAAEELGLEQAHTVATGKGVLVAVIDSAVDAAHPDLAGRVSMERDLVDMRKTPRHGEVHGTAVAGIIASLMNNDEGIVGVAPDVDLAALRACWPVARDGSGAECSSFSLAQALEIAVEIHARIINLSLAGPRDPLLEQLLDRAMAGGAIVVAAAPDGGPGVDSFPASHPDVIVARSGSDGARSGSPFVLPAPATEILTTVPDDGYAFLSGTSLAAAQVSGVLALLMERRPGLGAPQAAALLSSTIVRSGGDESVNACLALEKLMVARFCDPAPPGGRSAPGPASAFRAANLGGR